LVVLACSSGGNAVSQGGATRITIQQPETDALVLDTAVTASGDLEAPSGVAPAVTVEVEGATPQPAVVTGSEWEAAGLALPSEVNKLTARSGQVSNTILVTRGDGLSQQAGQRVLIDWTSAAVEELKGIARDTLDQSLSEAQLTVFASAVQDGVLAVLASRYAEWDIEFATAPGPDVHTIQMLGLTGNIFGQSPYDCGNGFLQQSSEVWVGTYRSSMSQVDRWPPMQRSDPLDRRIEDVTQALARTSAHELGHSVGMVGSERLAPCGWMSGCHRGHNCDFFDQFHVGMVDRFASGRYIMDPGHLTRNHWRLAERFETGREPAREPAVFNHFNGSYLSTVHPR
jgi:hypothetical protein